MLFARVLPEHSPATQFADMRAAYKTLPADLQHSLLGLEVCHSIAHSRQTLGFEFSAEEAAGFPGAVHPLILALPRTGERSLYLASHAASIEGWNLPEARLLLRELMEQSTREANVFSHVWQPGDLVVWDNRVTMHRARAFADASVRRELTRVTTLDVAQAARAAA
jgi:alpha-ketoglutarate-dependent 2,4-dichlorophenoxyacetate dioxygenase